MESGKREEAGPSCGSAALVRELNNNQEKRLNETEEDMGFDDDDDDDDEDFEKMHQVNKRAFQNFVPGPLLPLKEQIEKDKEDESLRRWKEKLLGCLESDLNGQMEPQVIFQSIGIISSDFGELNSSLPVSEEQKKDVLFSLREGSDYNLKLTFTVRHNIVSGLAYTNIVWKSGLQVDQSKGMLGTFAPQREPYVHTLEEETTPSGVLARGIYTAKLKFEDDDRRCHMELNYSFEIRKSSC